MSEEGLVTAMRIGSLDPLSSRSDTDLGRFGFGLKTASFSQARELTVGTRRRAKGPLFTRCWDLDHVRSSGRWQMRRKPPAAADAILQRDLAKRAGTCVIWRNLPRVVTGVEESDEVTAQIDFLRVVSATEVHLGMTFARLIQRNLLHITLNGSAVAPWDPFLQDHSATQALPEEKLILRKHSVLVRPFVLPHATKLTHDQQLQAEGPQGWNEHQGFYVYRRNRLITAGDWLDLRLARNDSHNLARIAIDIPPELDHEWGLNINKTTVSPPRPLLGDLRRIANETRRRAKKVYSSRGGEVRQRGGRATVRTVWGQSRRNTDIRFRIDRKHPLVEAALKEAGPARRSIEDLLKVIEATIPIPYLPTKRPAEQSILEDEPPELLHKLAERIYENLLLEGKSRARAAEELLGIEPFDQHPEIISALTERI